MVPKHFEKEEEEVRRCLRCRPLFDVERDISRVNIKYDGISLDGDEAVDMREFSNFSESKKRKGRRL